MSLDNAEALTVQALIRVGAAARRTETIQPIVSRWSVANAAKPRGRIAFDTQAALDGDPAGYLGGIFDGRHIVFSPQHDANPELKPESRHGRVLRYDCQDRFDDIASWSVYDAGMTDGQSCAGYYGAVFTGKHVLFPPRRDNDGFHTRVLRLDTQAPFDNPAAWAAHDLGIDRSYQGGAFDGRYVYMCPGHLAQRRSAAAAAAAEGDTLEWDTVHGQGTSIFCGTLFPD